MKRQLKWEYICTYIYIISLFWEFYTYFDHILLPPTLPVSIPLTTMYWVFLFSPSSTPMCTAWIFLSVWPTAGTSILVFIRGYILRKKQIFPSLQLRIINSTSTRGGISCPTPLSTFRFCFTQICTGLLPAVLLPWVHMCNMSCCVPNKLSPCRYPLPLAYTSFHSVFVNDTWAGWTFFCLLFSAFCPVIGLCVDHNLLQINILY